MPRCAFCGPCTFYWTLIAFSVVELLTAVQAICCSLKDCMYSWGHGGARHVEPWLHASATLTFLFSETCTCLSGSLWGSLTWALFLNQEQPTEWIDQVCRFAEFLATVESYEHIQGCICLRKELFLLPLPETENPAHSHRAVLLNHGYFMDMFHWCEWNILPSGDDLMLVIPLNVRSYWTASATSSQNQHHLWKSRLESTGGSWKASNFLALAELIS